MDVAIRDEDLRQQLDKARGAPGFQTLVRLLEQTQAERDSERLLSPVERRRVETRKMLQAERLEDEDRHHIHSVLALCGLPYRRPSDPGQDVYVRRYGKNSLLIQAGYLEDPMSGQHVHQGLPYGPKARLLLLHICTMAIRQKSPEIEIADSMSAFIRELGFPVTGGKKGTLPQFKEQLNRLAASRMQIGLWRGDRQTTIKTQAIEAFDVWLPNNADQKMLWASTLRLDEKFYQSLREHALPVDIRVVQAFSQSARQMDLVLWLGYRLRSLDRRYVINWETLQAQFGSELSRARRFREEFRDDLAAVLEVFPKLPAQVTDQGLMLSPCAPEELFVPTARSVQARIRASSSD